MDIHRLVVAIILIAGVGSRAFAQQGTSSIRGRVADEQGAALPGVTVTVTHQDTGVARQTVSGPDGTYLVSNLVPGVYVLTATFKASAN